MATRRLPANHPWRRVNGRLVFDPYQPTAQQPTPPGLYDPALDATLGQAGRGFQDLVQQAQTQAQRMQTDYGLGMENIGREESRGREDLATGSSRETQNYGLATQGVQRSYAQRGAAQRQQQNAYGVLTGGAGLQAAQKRAANMALDQQALDVSHARSQEDAVTSGRRLGENADLARGNLALQSAPPDAANPLGGRDWQDMGTRLGVGARELGALGIDTERARAYSAAQLGYVAPGVPRNEATNPLTGRTTRSYVIGGVRYTVDPSGRIIAKRRVS